MKISAKTEYACIAMLELASSHSTGEPVRIREIAEKHEIPQRFLVQILLQLKGAGLVTSTRGSAGGYQLAGRPEEVTLADVIDVIEGPSETVANARADSPATVALAEVWQEISSVEREMLADISFAELAERAEEPQENMYYI